MIVGFMEPVGTVFQSASALRKMTIRTTNSVSVWYSFRSFANLFVMRTLLSEHRSCTSHDIPSSFQRERHIGHTLDRIRIIRRNLPESQRTIKRLRFLHSGQRIENDAIVSRLPRLADHRLGKHAPEPPPPSFRADIEPLHLAVRSLQRAQPDSSENSCAIHRQQQTPSRPRIVPRQRRELVGEALETEIDTKRRLIFDEQPARLLDIAARLHFTNHGHRQSLGPSIRYLSFTSSTSGRARRHDVRIQMRLSPCDDHRHSE